MEPIGEPESRDTVVTIHLGPMNHGTYYSARRTTAVWDALAERES